MRETKKQAKQKGLRFASVPRANFAVTLVTPGATHTSFAAAARADDSLVFRVPGLAQDAPSAARAMVEGILAGRRLVQPGALTALVSTLAPRLPSKLTHFVDFVLWGRGDWRTDFFGPDAGMGAAAPRAQPPAASGVSAPRRLFGGR